MKTKELEGAKRILEEVLRKRFEDIALDSIEMKPEFDSDGDEILRVWVVFDDTVKEIHPEKTLDLVHLVRPRLTREAGTDVYANEFSNMAHTASMVFPQIIKKQKQHIIIIAVFPPDQQSIQHHCYIPMIILSTFHYCVGKNW